MSSSYDFLQPWVSSLRATQLHTHRRHHRRKEREYFQLWQPSRSNSDHQYVSTPRERIWMCPSRDQNNFSRQHRFMPPVAQVLYCSLAPILRTQAISPCVLHRSHDKSVFVTLDNSQGSPFKEFHLVLRCTAGKRLVVCRVVVSRFRFRGRAI